MSAYAIEKIRPLYQALIEKAEKKFGEFIARAQKNPYDAIRWAGDTAANVAIELHWLKGTLRYCEELAENGNPDTGEHGCVRREDVADMIERAFRQQARDTSWSSNPLAAIMHRAEVVLLARASEPFGDELLSPFDRLQRDEEWAAAHARDEASMWRVGDARGNRYMRADGGWTGNIQKAGVWSYKDKPTIDSRKQRYIRVEA